MVKTRCSASDRIRVPARPAQHVHRCVPDLRRHGDAGRAGVHLHRRRATTELTIGPAEADQAGARPYLRRCAGTPGVGFWRMVSYGGGGAVLLRIINSGRNARRSMAPGVPRILAKRMSRLSRAITSKSEVAVVRGG